MLELRVLMRMNKSMSVFHTRVLNNLIFCSEYTTREKELYAQILNMIPVLDPVIHACCETPKVFAQFVKLVRI